MTYVRPAKLVVPERPPLLVYLDLNHWIALAKAHSGHRDGVALLPVLEACQDASDQNRAVFPLTDSLYFEISKIGRYRQRHHLREVIERVSAYAVVASRSLIAKLEVDAVLEARHGPRRQPLGALAYLDWGVMRALGMDGSPRIKDSEGRDITDKVRATYPGGVQAFEDWVWSAKLGLNRYVLDGPAPEDEAEARAFGWDPTAAFAVAARRADQEIEQVARFDQSPLWRQGRLRDVIALRELAMELWEHLADGAVSRGLSVDDVFPDPDQGFRMLDEMPSLDTAVSIKVEYHRNPRHRWKPNDITDIDALGSTVPYCDVVVTDRQAAAALASSGLTDRVSTRVLSRLEDLLPLL